MPAKLFYRSNKYRWVTGISRYSMEVLIKLHARTYVDPI